MTTPDLAVRVTGVTKRFRVGRGRDVTAVADVSAAIGRGQIVALMGDNGAGKSTLLDLVCGLTTPTEGSVEVLGGTPGEAVRDRRLGAVLQTGGLLPDLTVGETVGIIASLCGRRPAAEDAIARAGLATLTDRRIGVCSGGERQRVKFALALVSQAELLVLDEPTAGMDWGARADFWDEMRALGAGGATLLYATHYADEVEGIAERVLVLSGGRLVADTTVEAIRKAGAEAGGTGAEGGGGTGGTPVFFAGLDALTGRSRNR